MSARQAPTYLDHNATTPADPRVVEAMLPFFTSTFGNPSSVEHIHGHAAQTAVGDARAKVARALGARDNEVVFTGSCTEANNIAILGAARAQPDRRHVVTTAVEHPAVLEPMRQLAREGYELTVIGVDRFGQVDPGAVAAALRDDTLLVSVMGANNEVGTTQPLAPIGAECERRGVLLHSDLAQVMAHGPFDVGASNVHLASVSGHKAYGPKGVGALYARSRGPRARLAPVLFGGGQERGLRSGTLNVPLIVGMAEALAISSKEGRADDHRLAGMCRTFAARVMSALDGVELNGHPTDRIAGNCSLSIAGVEPLALMHNLREVASFSASSACATDKVETSHVLLAMFGDTPRARQAFRVSPGRFTTEQEMERFTDALIGAVGELRRFAA
ncbi:MAG: aminotransferase class V-fold PLP-dependent enzyme [Sphingomonas sp.]|uniref:cysteine desulfurase family protein n=1 Tax=Sphingomonas sp. TaxID=28214 RepID=UPI0011F98B2B|nr:aminotransferase class V-fold PLP-dependent enzyme [Sphingomonas sp.]THD34464.1 MAG: aminotransferase class V-fold PLP-dependent enzyme [Sphingomonas sp.]